MGVVIDVRCCEFVVVDAEASIGGDNTSDGAVVVLKRCCCCVAGVGGELSATAVSAAAVAPEVGRAGTNGGDMRGCEIAPVVVGDATATSGGDCTIALILERSGGVEDGTAGVAAEGVMIEFDRFCTIA